MAKTLALYRSGLLAYYEHPITSGPLEGTNNKIKTMKRQAYGYRSNFVDQTEARSKLPGGRNAKQPARN
jgi:hypothetical protein